MTESAAHILVVEDETDLRELLVLHLKREGYSVSAFESAEDALSASLLIPNNLSNDKTTPLSLAVLDWMLPKMSGLDLCKEIRTKFGIQVPILILTARADTRDKVKGLEIGADDYLTKPFEVREFIARVRALLRRSQAGSVSIVGGTRPASQKELQYQKIRINLDSKKSFIGSDELNLTPHEFKLLTELMKKPGTTFSRETLIALIQSPNVSVVDRTIDTTILGLRKKLGSYSEAIETVRGFGYRLK